MDSAENVVEAVECIDEAKSGAASASGASGGSAERIGRTSHGLPGRSRYVDIVELEDCIAYVKLSDDYTKGWHPEITYVPKYSNPGVTDVLAGGDVALAQEALIKCEDVVKPIVESISTAPAVESLGVSKEFSPILNIDPEENVGEARRDASGLEQLLDVNQPSISSTAASEVTSTVPNNELQCGSEPESVPKDEHDIASAGGGVGTINVTGHKSTSNDDTPLELMFISEKEEQQENLATGRNAAVFHGSPIDSVASVPEKLTAVTSETHPEDTKAHVELIETDEWDVPVSSGPASTTRIHYPSSKTTTTSPGVQRERNGKYENRRQSVQEERGRERTFDGGRRMGKFETLFGLRRTTLKPGDPWAPAQVLKLLTTKGYVIEERIFFFMCKADGSIQMLEYEGRWVKDSIFVVELVCKLNAELVARGVAESDYKPLAFNAAALELIKEIRKLEATLPEVRVPFVLQMKPVAYFDMLKVIERKTRRAPVVNESFEHENGTKWYMCEVQYPVDGKTHHIRRTGISSVLARLAAAHDVLRKLEPRRTLHLRELATCVDMAEETLSRVLRICPDRGYAPSQLDLIPLPSVADAQPTPQANVGHCRAPQRDQRYSRDSGSEAQRPTRASFVYSSQAVNTTKIPAVSIEDDWDLPNTTATRASSGSSTEAVHNIVAKSPAVSIEDDWDLPNSAATGASSGSFTNAVQTKVSKSSAVSIEDDWDLPSTASSSCPLVNIPNDANSEFEAEILQGEFTKTANQTYVIKADEADIHDASGSVASLQNIGERREKGSSDTLSLSGEPEVMENAASGSRVPDASQNVTDSAPDNNNETYHVFRENDDRLNTIFEESVSEISVGQASDSDAMKTFTVPRSDEINNSTVNSNIGISPREFDPHDVKFSSTAIGDMPELEGNEDSNGEECKMSVNDTALEESQLLSVSALDPTDGTLELLCVSNETIAVEPLMQVASDGTNQEIFEDQPKELGIGNSSDYGHRDTTENVVIKFLDPGASEEIKVCVNEIGNIGIRVIDATECAKEQLPDSSTHHVEESAEENFVGGVKENYSFNLIQLDQREDVSNFIVEPVEKKIEEDSSFAFIRPSVPSALVEVPFKDADSDMMDLCTDDENEQERGAAATDTAFSVPGGSPSSSGTIKLDNSDLEDEVEDDPLLECSSPARDDPLVDNRDNVTEDYVGATINNPNVLAQLETNTSNTLSSSLLENLECNGLKLDAEAEIADFFSGIAKPDDVNFEAHQDLSALTMEDVGLLVDLNSPTYEDDLNEGVSKPDNTVTFWMGNENSPSDAHAAGASDNASKQDLMISNRSFLSEQKVLISPTPKGISDSLISLGTSSGAETSIFNTAYIASSASEESSSFSEIQRQDQSLCMPLGKNPSRKLSTNDAGTQTEIIDDLNLQTSDKKGLRPHGSDTEEVSVRVASTGTNTSFLDFEEVELFSAGAVQRRRRSSFAGSASPEDFLGNIPAQHQFNTIIVMLFVALVICKIAYYLWELFVLLLMYAFV